MSVGSFVAGWFYPATYCVTTPLGKTWCCRRCAVVLLVAATLWPNPSVQWPLIAYVHVGAVSVPSLVGNVFRVLSACLRSASW
ncbi:hypothetical protein OH492_14610 [Vibrio chagasii]|nr:hypothetical protein [Vibrio chagasii]